MSNKYQSVGGGSLTPLGHLLDTVLEEIPDGNIDLRTAARLIQLVDADRLREQQRKTMTERAQPEIVRVMRVYVFEGERKAVEEQIAHSLGDGTRYVSYRPSNSLIGKGIKIHVATIGSMPQILPLNAGHPGWAEGDQYRAPIVQPLGGRLVYVCQPTKPGEYVTPEEQYRAAVAVGADAILSWGTNSGNRVLYSLESWRESFDYGTKKWDAPQPPAVQEITPAGDPPVLEIPEPLSEEPR